MAHVGRREFVGLLVCAAAWPISLKAQRDAPRIGWLAFDVPENHRYFDALRQGVRDLGYIEGQSLIIDPRWVNSRDRVLDAARELTALKVRAIVVQGGITTYLRGEIESTPIVFVTSGDPVIGGYVQSFNRPGRNFTGATLMSYEINGKRIELLQEVFPHVTHVGVLSNPMHPGEFGELKVTEAAAERLGLKLSYGRIVSAADVELAFKLVRSQGADAINVLPDGGMMQHREKLAALAAQQRIPVVSGWQEFTRAGGVMSYGPNVAQTYRRIAASVDKILKGAQASELPVEQPTKFELVVNLKAAKGLGLTIPPSVMLRADEVIE
jgi:putative tryptophan/tyrosine transport system substrate-binding protein